MHRIKLYPRLNVKPLLWMVAFVLMVGLIPAQPVAAAAYVVTSLADSGDGTCDATCTLRDALLAANANASDDTITLLSRLPNLANNGALTIDGGGNITVTRSSVVTNFRIFEVNSGANSTLNGLTITNGNVCVLFGGGILNSGGTLTVTNSTISGNTTGNGGGGIFNSGGSTLTVTNSTISGNSADEGGGIFNAGTLMVTNSTISESLAGGGIYNNDGNISVTDSFIQQNTGGAIAFGSSGTHSVTNTCIVLNTDTAVTFTSGSGVIATNNWWGTAAGPYSGVAAPNPPNDNNTSSSYGDSVTPSANPAIFDYSGYQTTAPVGCFACSVPSAIGGAGRDSRVCTLVTP